MSVFGFHACHEQVPTALVQAVQQRAWREVLGKQVLPQVDVAAEVAA